MSDGERDDRFRGWAWAALASGLAFVALAGWRTIGVGGIWHHLAIGRIIAEHGIPRTDPLSFVTVGRAWTGANWLYDILVHAVWSVAGAAGLAAIHVAAVVGSLALCLRALWRWAGAASGAAALLLVGWMLAPVFSPRPDVFAVIFPSVFLLLLSSPRRPAVLWGWLVPVQVLWANMDSSFALGPIMALVAGVEARTGVGEADPPNAAGARRRATSLFMLAGILILASMLNPRGPLVFGHALRPVFQAVPRIFEVWISPYSSHFAPLWARHSVTIALVLGAFGLVTHRSRLPLLTTAMAVFSAFLVIRSIAFLPLFAVMSFPFLCVSMKDIGAAISRGTRGAADATRAGYGRMGISVAVTLLAGLSIWSFAGGGYFRAVGSDARFGTGAGSSSLPEGPVEVLKRYPAMERVFNLPVDGGYLAWAAPGRPVFADMRSEVYGAEFGRMMNRIVVLGETNIRDLFFSRWNIDAAVLNCCSPGADILLRSLLDGGTWVLVYFDGTYAVAVQEKSKYRDLIADAALQADGLKRLNEETWRAESDLAQGRRPDLSARLVGGAFFFSAMDRNAAAARLFRILLAAAPRMEGARFQLAICQARMGQFPAAEHNLLSMTGNRRYASESWRWLSQIYRKQGRPAEAEAGARRAGSRPSTP